MSLSLLHVVIPFALYTAALGQATPPPECTNAAMAFSQKSACFGSQQPTNAFASSSGLLLFGGPLLLLNNRSRHQEATIIFNNFCASQACIQSYADAVQVCSEYIAQQVNFVINVCIYTHAGTHVE